MGKSSRKAKRKREDFQKVKLKLGKRLKKSNDTDTNFKAKRIVVRTQLKETDFQEEITVGNLTIQDCCRMASHYSVTKQKFALQLMNSFICNSVRLCQLNLSSILASVLPLLSSAQDQIRSAAVGLLKRVFNTVDTSLISSYFSILESYLRCSITHVDVKVKLSALRTFDNLIHSHPSFVCTNGKLMTFYVDLFMPNKSTSVLGRTGAIVGGSKVITTQLEQCRALWSFWKFLQAVNKAATAENHRTETSYLGPFCSAVLFEESSDTGERVDSVGVILKNLEKLFQPLMSLWLEVTSNSLCSRTESDLEIMYTVVGIMNCLFRLVNYNSSKKKYAEEAAVAVKEFGKLFQARNYERFVLQFPCHRGAEKRTGKDIPNEEDIFVGIDVCLQLNIALCELFCFVHRFTGLQFPHQLCAEYIFKIVEQRRLGSVLIESLFNVLGQFPVADKPTTTEGLLELFYSNRSSISVKLSLLNLINTSQAIGSQCTSAVDDLLEYLLQLSGKLKPNHFARFDNVVVEYCERHIHQLSSLQSKETMQLLTLSCFVHSASGQSTIVDQRIVRLLYNLVPLSKNALKQLFTFGRACDANLQRLLYVLEVLFSKYAQTWERLSYEQQGVWIYFIMAILHLHKVEEQEQNGQNRAVMFVCESPASPELRINLSLQCWLRSLKCEKEVRCIFEQYCNARINWFDEVSSVD
ncbi:Testis-expressed sequence 10 -like protein [Trichinella papuae]|uniref:Testis-expressed sequence 10-like protein n=1 Tax=Trichinella papuae TaxID=268474 RepID=A0A0V1N6U9_9BILA|nr:Testis-expressed sequence 10 -like protein [Trichinella papuae]